jgi:ABC-type Fe3+ transport system permease subunit
VFVLRGVTVLFNAVWVYAKLHHAVESNAQFKQGLHDSVANGVVSAAIALGCGLVCWLASKSLGRMLAGGLEEPATPSA